MSKSPSLRRIQADIRELSLDPSDRYHAAPLEDDMFEWHFTIRGAEGTDFEGGVYHGRILLPTAYPFKPPHIVFLTPSGRFETNVKVCLSFSAHHPELWQPAWGIRLILEALISFLPTPADGAIGSLNWKPAERKRMATKSKEYCCSKCGPIIALLPEIGSVKSTAKSRFEEEIAKLHIYQQLNETGNKEKGSDDEGNNKNKSASVIESSEAELQKKESSPLNNRDETKLNLRNAKTLARFSKKGSSNLETPLLDAEIKPVEKSSVTSLSDSVQLMPPEPQSTCVAATSTNGRTSDDRKQSSTQTAVVHEENERVTSDFSDPVVHAIIVTFVAIIALLYRKVQALLLALEELDK